MSAVIECELWHTNLFDRIFTVFRERRSRVGQSVTAPPYSFSALNFSECLSALLSLLKTSSLSNQMLNPRPWASEKDR